jgi:hypothetical protein
MCYEWYSKSLQNRQGNLESPLLSIWNQFYLLIENEMKTNSVISAH